MKSEKAKMLAGEFFDPLDPQLSRERQRCRHLCKRLNDSSEDEQERRRILAELLGSPTDAWIEPPFFCDYGYNIALGAKVFFNLTVSSSTSCVWRSAAMFFLARRWTDF